MIDKLIDRVRRNERKAQEEFYKKFANGLFRIAYRYVNNELDAADIVNMGFFKIFKSIQKFTYVSDLCTIGWMEKIVINEALMFLRRRWTYYDQNDNEIAENQTESRPDDNLLAEDYYKMIGRMPCDLRTVFNLYAIDGFTHKEIASQLGIKEESSRVYLTRARKMLQGYLTEKQTCHERK
jgi:RNA polymerase sigma-70 factor (ECF subfamily)